MSLFICSQLQQQEAEVARQKEANFTALAAIGPRKKRKAEADAQVRMDGWAGQIVGRRNSYSFPRFWWLQN